VSGPIKRILCQTGESGILGWKFPLFQFASIKRGFYVFGQTVFFLISDRVTPEDLFLDNQASFRKHLKLSLKFIKM